MAASAQLKAAPHYSGTIQAVPNDWPFERGGWTETWQITGAEDSFLKAIDAVGLPYPGQDPNFPSQWVYGPIRIEQTLEQDGTSSFIAYCEVVCDPLKLPTEIHVQTSHVSEAVWDTNPENGNRVCLVNTVGQPFPQGLEENRAKARVEIVTRVAKFDVTNVAQYVDHQNSERFMGFEKGQVYCADMRAPMVLDPVPHIVWTTVFEIDTRPSGYKRKILNQGTRHKESSTGKIVTNREGGQVADGGSALLDQNGYVVPVGGEPYFIEKDTIPFADFNLLHLVDPPPAAGATDWLHDFAGLGKIDIYRKYRKSR
jgi:hypothetical protein